MEITGSVGSMRPMKKVRASNPTKVVSTEPNWRRKPAMLMAPPLLGRAAVIDEERRDHEVLHRIPDGDWPDGLVDISHRAVMHHGFLDRVIHRGPLGGIALHARGVCLLVDLQVLPAGAP